MLSEPVRSTWIIAFGLILVGAVGTSCTSTSVSAGPPPPHIVGQANIEGERFCDVSIVYRLGSGYLTNIYSSFPIDSCPEAEWMKVTPTSISKLDGGLAVTLDGPRYWLIDALSRDVAGEEALTTTTMGTITMHLVATAHPASLHSAPYTPQEVTRAATLTFRTGQQIHELTDPSHRRWVMESWSQSVDPDLRQADLASLQHQLSLPGGWSYSTRRLSRPLVISSVESAARVLQDNLANEYSLESTTNG